VIHDALVAIDALIESDPRAAEERIAELSALLRHGLREGTTAQLDPHFLFNALNAISALLEDDAPGARALTTRLQAFLRRADAGDRQQVTLAEELDLLQAYVDIESVRFGLPLQLVVSCDAAARGTLLPPLTLLPLVQTAVQQLPRGGGSMAVSATLTGESLRVEVRTANQVRCIFLHAGTTPGHAIRDQGSPFEA
jgi:two-component system LytT family sensor kinase